MAERGIGAAELWRRARRVLPPETRFAHGNIAQYRRGLAIPREEYLNALCSALNTSPQELVPPKEGAERRLAQWDSLVTSSPAGEGNRIARPLLVEARPGGRAWLSLNHELP
jgi:transcriptional regulator with XRE-family HTH domain